MLLRVVASRLLIVICWIHLTFATHQYESNNNGLRGSRPRNGNKRQPTSSSVYSIEHNGADNQWKPILDLPPNHFGSSIVKHRKLKQPYRIPPPLLLKQSPNVIFTTEYYPKQLHQSASTNFIANQSLLVASSDYDPSQQQIKTQHLGKTKHYQKEQQQQRTYIPTTHTGSAHYEVHEQVNEEGGYESRFRYPETAPVTEKHLHHVHYHKGTVLNDGQRHLGRPSVRKVRLSGTSRRPY